MAGFWVCPADDNGDRIVGAEVRFSPGPSAVDYPLDHPGSDQQTDGGRVIHQEGPGDPRTKAWLWSGLPRGEPTARYDRLIASLENLLSRSRREQGLSPYVFLRDQETDRLGRWTRARGTATAISTNTLTDTSQSWATDLFANGVAEISLGAAQGIRRSLLSNTGTVLTLSDDWGDTAPTAGSKYVVTAWSGDWVRVRVVNVNKQPTQGGTTGTAQGQVRLEFVVEPQDTLVGHYVADDAVTAGSEVTSIPDRSGYGSTLTKTATGPTYSAGSLGGHATIGHSGTKHMVAKPLRHAVEREFSMLAVLNFTATGGSSSWFWTESDFGGRFGLGAVLRSGLYYVGGTFAGLGSVDCGVPWVAGQYEVMGVQWRDGILEFYRNGEQVGRAPFVGAYSLDDITSAATDAFSLDGAADGTGAGGTFSWAEWCVYDGVFSATRLRRRSRALCVKYGIATPDTPASIIIV